ncbi:MAG: hypothetical protein IIW03_01310, partial [Clostridia bacterium]|nr:hypothetical protein [Clostridia bacterium]
CTRPDENGKEKTFESVITFEDIYELYDATNGQGSMYGSYSYTITNSNIEIEHEKVGEKVISKINAPSEIEVVIK